MNGGYAENNYLNVKRAKYVGASVAKPLPHSVVKTPTNNNANTQAPKTKTVAKYGGINEKYRIASTKTKVTSVAKPISTGNAINPKGFVYVEHSGFVGTFKDAFCTKRLKSKEKSCFDKIVTILVFAVLMFFVAGSYCEYNDAFNEVKQLKSQIAESREEQSKLLVAIEERNNSINLEEYAVNNLGMVSADKLTKHYINISEKDAVNIIVNEKQPASSGVVLSGFKNIWSNIVGEN